MSAAATGIFQTGLRGDLALPNMLVKSFWGVFSVSLSVDGEPNRRWVDDS